MIGFISTGALLILCTVFDLKYRKIPVILCGLVSVFVIFLHLIFRDLSIFDMGLGLMSGGVFIGISILTHGKLGLGDGILLTSLGPMLGFNLFLSMTFLALLFTAGFGAARYLWKRDRRALPFCPFLLTAEVVTVVLWLVTK